MYFYRKTPRDATSVIYRVFDSYRATVSELGTGSRQERAQVLLPLPSGTLKISVTGGFQTSRHNIYIKQKNVIDLLKTFLLILYIFMSSLFLSFFCYSQLDAN